MKKSKIFRLTMLGIFTAIAIILTFTPLGYIVIPIPALTFSITTIHIPIIVAGIILGTMDGAIVGLITGILCLLKAAFNPLAATDMFFVNPMISVFPRVLIGVFASLVFLGVLRLFKEREKPRARLVSATVAAIAGTLTNTIGVLGMFALFLPADFATSSGGEGALSFIFSMIIGTNGIFELVAAIVVGVPIVLALDKVSRRANTR